MHFVIFNLEYIYAYIPCVKSSIFASWCSPSWSYYSNKIQILKKIRWIPVKAVWFYNSTWVFNLIVHNRKSSKSPIWSGIFYDPELEHNHPRGVKPVYFFGMSLPLPKCRSIYCAVCFAAIHSLLSEPNKQKSTRSAIGCDRPGIELWTKNGTVENNYRQFVQSSGWKKTANWLNSESVDHLALYRLIIIYINDGLARVSFLISV